MIISSCPCCGFKPNKPAPFAVNPELNTLSHAGDTVRLTPQETRFVDGVLRTWPQPIPYERHLLIVWPGDDYYEVDGLNAIKVCASKLRRKLAAVGLALRTDWGVGFSIVVERIAVAA